ncbi:MAG TPA: polysaccharide biosynthesis C-terminal domain-containing protein [Candidatus Cloacimonas sp.]|nr:polysaccharide biosynthesis C-terminal domain-containing protein [Candidatus Cloacimonas sp.]MDD2250093.1 polysaccharide biosynthesis C-terminal domain-containing protein [Candidatus Cloacimonadota bacterium]MCK9164582.1 polysaccharide biosynthesis C-terminal domain-containing protein [Candidatus Cloacimonas sp.]MDD4677006.1 polysaccharide biosynthesis C-terminal domain-containing protein [Candidatus Cloacimonadota bacterium]HNV93140.1 polysaccharide biosynthesis C-terminal domain-containing
MSQINLKKNIITSGSFRIVILILSFLISWISARYLGVTLKGEYSYLITLCGFMWTVLDLGVYRSYPYIVRKRPDEVQTLFGWTIITMFFEIVVMTSIGVAFLDFWNKLIGYQLSPVKIIFLVMFVSLNKAFMQLQAIYMGMNRVLENSISHFLISVVFFILLLIGYFALIDVDRIDILLLFNLIGLACSVLYLAFRNRWGNWYKELNIKTIKLFYSYGFRVFLSSLFIMLLIRADIVLIKHFLDFSEVGIYSLAAHIVDFIQIASNLVGGLLFVKLSDIEDDISKWLLLKKTLLIFFFFITLANLGFGLIGKPVMQIMFGADFVPVYYVYFWLMPAAYGLSFGSLFNNYLNSKGFPIISIILPAIALVLNITLNMLLIPTMGINGAALATSISYFLWFLLIVYFEQRDSKGKMLHYLMPTWKDVTDLYRETVIEIKEMMNNISHKKA